MTESQEPIGPAEVVGPGAGGSGRAGAGAGGSGRAGAGAGGSGRAGAGVVGCPDCGALTQPEDAFCEHCGSPLGVVPAAPGGGVVAPVSAVPGDPASGDLASDGLASSSQVPGGLASSSQVPGGLASDGLVPGGTVPVGGGSDEAEAEIDPRSAPTVALAPPVPAEYGSPFGAVLPDAVATTYIAEGSGTGGASAVVPVLGGPVVGAAAVGGSVVGGAVVGGAVAGGTGVATLRVCTRCGGTVAPDGYCLECGEPAASERDHFRESPAAWIGGVCDRGIVHQRNEDAMALAVHHDPVGPASGTAVLVVCDGVSSAPDSDVASLAAARAALSDVLTALAEPGEQASRGAYLARTLGTAAHAANEAVRATTPPGSDAANPPSCTYVACAVEPGVVAVAWVGDSRAYWLPDAGTPVQLTTDHSWASEMIALGMPRAEAEAARHAHAITRWLGGDAPEGDPSTAVLTPFGPGWVLVCSDGLWNYCSQAADLVTLMADVAGDTSDPTERAAALVRWACDRGGRDNVTVALARVERVEGVG